MHVAVCTLLEDEGYFIFEVEIRMVGRTGVKSNHFQSGE